MRFFKKDKKTEKALEPEIKKSEAIGITIKDIPVDSIIPNPNQPRKSFKREQLEELAESIKIFGVISPIQVRKIDESAYELVSGERRLRAAKLADLKTIPAIEMSIGEKDSAVIAIIENVQREDLTFFEEAESYRQLMKYYEMTQEEIAGRLGKSQSFVANKIRLLKLSPKIVQKIKDAGLSERHARALIRVPDEDIQSDVIDQILKKDLNVKKTEALVEEIRNNVLTNNYDEKITREKKARVKSFINAQIYINTIKSAYKEIKQSRKDVSYQEKEKDDSIQIVITIPK